MKTGIFGCFGAVVSGILVSVIAGTGTAKAEDVVAQLPENVMPVAAPPPVQPVKKSCLILQYRRGPGLYSRWENGDRPYYNEWNVWIGDEKMNPSTYGNYLKYSTCDWFHRDDDWAGYGGYNKSCSDRKDLAQSLPAATLSGNYDPCNRVSYSESKTCWANHKDMPVDYTHTDGLKYRFMNKLREEGGTCGSDDCLCLIGGLVSPLVIDLEDHGLVYTSFGEHVSFDFGQGKEPVTWLKNSGVIPFLALDRNGNGAIDDIQEMFGDGTKSANGNVFENGFEALAEYDGNKDGVINAGDVVWAKLVLWFDKNVNGVTDRGEMMLVSESKVKSISVKYNKAVSNQDQFGNMARQWATVSLSSGEERRVYDVWFAPVTSESVKGMPGGSKLDTLPRIGDAMYEATHSAWEQTLAKEGFGQNELPYERGYLQLVRDANGQPKEQVGIWKHGSAPCRVEISFSPDWKVKDGHSVCH